MRPARSRPRSWSVACRRPFGACRPPANARSMVGQERLRQNNVATCRCLILCAGHLDAGLHSVGYCLQCTTRCALQRGAPVEHLAEVKVVAFNKTGTLTNGTPQVTNVIPLSDISDANPLTTAAAVEPRSEHPLAQAVVAAAPDRDLSFTAASNLQAVPGKRVTAQFNGRGGHWHRRPLRRQQLYRTC